MIEIEAEAEAATEVAVVVESVIALGIEIAAMVLSCDSGDVKGSLKIGGIVESHGQRITMSFGYVLG